MGAGSAGCALANRLSASGTYSVAILEAGPKDTNPWIHIPVGYFKTMGNPNSDWGYKTEADDGIAGRSIPWPRGRVLGGSSSINGLLYVRGQRQDYDAWAQMGNTGWNWDNVLPYFKRSETWKGDGDHPCDDIRGKDGPLSVQPSRLNREIVDKWVDAAEAAGYRRNPDYNGADQEGVGYFQLTMSGGRRCSSAVAYLKPARGRANLTILTNAQTEKVLIEAGRASGVRARVNGQMKDIIANCEVILSAGAIGSPQLLQVSGIGPGGLLREFGIDVLQDAPQVGQNLQDHLQLRCAYKVHGTRTLNTVSASLWGKAKIALEYAARRTGPMSMSPSQLGIFARSGPQAETADLEYHVQPLSLDAFGEDLHEFDAVTASVCFLRPESRGHVNIVSADPFASPEIAPNYLSAAKDQQVAADSIRLTRKIMQQPALSPFRPMEFRPGSEVESEADLIRAAGDIGTTIFHPVGTVHMGPNADAPLDPQLRLRGVRGLRVVDASVMPTIPSGNTNSPTIMIAEKAADMILSDAKNGQV